MKAATSALLALLVATLGCTAQVAPKLTAVSQCPDEAASAAADGKGGYRLCNRTAKQQDPDRTFIVMSASGGGTRAAAWTFGAMAALNGTEIGRGQSMLDELDVLSSVSGGSFVAAYYGLFPDEFFTRAPEEVLYRRLHWSLAAKVLAPWNLLRLLSPQLSRSDLAADYYDDTMFRGRRFRDLSPARPFIMLNATDLWSGGQFSFIQDRFDSLCADLDELPVAVGVTASSAFPVAFPPLTMRNYPKSTCRYEAPLWVELAESDFDVAPERWSLARNERDYENPARRFIHLSDGGLADNIGIRPLVSASSRGDALGIDAGVNQRRIQRIVAIVVDAKPRGEPDSDRSAHAPWFGSVLSAAATRPMENYSAESVERVRSWFKEWDTAAATFDAVRSRCDALGTGAARCRRQQGVEDKDRPPHPRLHIIHVRFDAIPAEYAKEKERLQKTVTALQIDRDDVKLLARWACRLLTGSPEYQALVEEVRAESGLAAPESPFSCDDLLAETTKS